MKSKLSTTKGSGKLSPSLDPDLAKWCAALTAPIVEDTVPPGWHTSRELSKRLCKSESRMGELLQAALAAGKCERKEFRINLNGRSRPVPHYRLK